MMGELRTILTSNPPGVGEVAVVETLTHIAIDRVFRDRRVADDKQDEMHHMVRDYVECAALFGFLLGRNRALANHEEVRGECQET